MRIIIKKLQNIEHSYFAYLRGVFKQTIFKELDKIKKIEPVKDGYGEGSFVVIKAGKERQIKRILYGKI